MAEINAAHYAQLRHQSLDAVNRFLSQYTVFQKVQRSTGLPPWVLAFVTAGIVAFTYTRTFGVAGLLVSAYFTFKALEGNNPDLHMRWLKYWIVYGTASVTEKALDILLYWVPYCEFVRKFFMFLILIPHTGAAVWVYDHVIGPVFRSQRHTIDSSLERVQRKALEASSEVQAVTSSLVRNAASGIASAAIKAR